MIQNCNIYRVLKLFLDDPLKGFRLREISRILKLGLPSVSKYVKNLKKQGLIIEKEIYRNRLWFGNKKSRFFNIYQKFENIRLVEESGLIDFLNKELKFPAIAIYNKEAKINLFIIVSNKKNIKIDKFEKKIGKKLNLIIHTKDEFKKINNKKLINNVLNGTVLSRYAEVF